MRQAGGVDSGRHHLAALLAVIALALSMVIVDRVSAGPDPSPQDLTPIVIKPPAKTAPPKPTPTAESPRPTKPRPVPKPARTAQPSDDDDDDDGDDDGGDDDDDD